MELHPLTVPAGIASLSLLAVAGLIARSVSAGPLDPPAGTVNSTYKTLNEVEPRIALSDTNTPGDTDSVYRISQPGSYYLTGNVIGGAGKSGIEIASGEVTLDLNGFRVVGAQGTLQGIAAENVSDVTVRNGSVYDWDAHGLWLSNVTRACVEDVSSVRNAQSGIWVGPFGAVRRCTVDATQEGIVAGAGSSISECRVTQCIGDGIHVLGQSLVSSCIVQGCATGVLAGGNGTIVQGCTVTQSVDGITILGMNSVLNCQVSSNSTGIYAPGHGSLIEDCTAVGNTGSGIRVANDCIVRRNHCRNNVWTGDGVLVTGTNNRIEDNHCASNNRGVHVAGSGNFIVRNACSDNTTDWVFAANNVFGRIRDRRSPGSPPVNGFDAPDSLGTAEANANFSY